ncbi:hypothetical protein P280DRAFT_480148 [Massarina eburnea CBS 473.64]|uniref:Uncharacterized protein n=1 Tax=Massarina eburnea CBS 473.64 TaxID=1395130 RepID=A0A6A6S0B9_9PLEO|nr:hypothetical protein P280DRAFT_480148 [Massarina eburnea CBS 473.64]
MANVNATHAPYSWNLVTTGGAVALWALTEGGLVTDPISAVAVLGGWFGAAVIPTILPSFDEWAKNKNINLGFTKIGSTVVEVRPTPSTNASSTADKHSPSTLRSTPSTTSNSTTDALSPATSGVEPVDALPETVHTPTASAKTEQKGIMLSDKPVDIPSSNWSDFTWLFSTLWVCITANFANVCNYVEAYAVHVWGFIIGLWPGETSTAISTQSQHTENATLDYTLTSVNGVKKPPSAIWSSIVALYTNISVPLKNIIDNVKSGSMHVVSLCRNLSLWHINVICMGAVILYVLFIRTADQFKKFFRWSRYPVDHVSVRVLRRLDPVLHGLRNSIESSLAHLKDGLKSTSTRMWKSIKQLSTELSVLVTHAQPNIFQKTKDYTQELYQWSVQKSQDLRQWDDSKILALFRRGGQKALELEKLVHSSWEVLLILPACPLIFPIVRHIYYNYPNLCWRCIFNPSVVPNGTVDEVALVPVSQLVLVVTQTVYILRAVDKGRKNVNMVLDLMVVNVSIIIFWVFSYMKLILPIPLTIECWTDFFHVLEISTVTTHVWYYNKTDGPAETIKLTSAVILALGNIVGCIDPVPWGDSHAAFENLGNVYLWDRLLSIFQCVWIPQSILAFGVLGAKGFVQSIMLVVVLNLAIWLAGSILGFSEMYVTDYIIGAAAFLVGALIGWQSYKKIQMDNAALASPSPFSPTNGPAPSSWGWGGANLSDPGNGRGAFDSDDTGDISPLTSRKPRDTEKVRKRNRDGESSNDDKEDGKETKKSLIGQMLEGSEKIAMEWSIAEGDNKANDAASEAAPDKKRSGLVDPTTPSSPAFSPALSPKFIERRRSSLLSDIEAAAAEEGQTADAEAGEVDSASQAQDDGKEDGDDEFRAIVRLPVSQT